MLDTESRIHVDLQGAVANGSLQCKTNEEEGVDGGSGINEADELQVEKVDAAKALELKMVEVTMRSPELEVAENRIDETLNPSSDYSLSVREQEDENRGINGLSEDDKFTELFQLVCTTVSCPSPEVSNHVNTEAPSISETVQETPNLQKTGVTLSSVDCNMDTVNSEGDLITFKSAQLEVKDTGAINELSGSLGLVTEDGVKIEDTVILQNVPKNGHVDFEADEQVTSNVVGEKTADAVMGTEKSLPNTVIDDDLLSSRPSEVDSEKIEGELLVGDTSPVSVGEVCASEAQMTPPSMAVGACAGVVPRCICAARRLLSFAEAGRDRSCVLLLELLLSFAKVCHSSPARGSALFFDEFLVGVTHDMTESRL